jgi:6-phosphofructokinase 1
MSIAIMCSGGDAAGMNPAIKEFVEYSLQLSLDPYLIYDGLEGLIDDKIVKATREHAGGIASRGGTIIRSSRSKRFFDIEFRKQAFDNLNRRGIDKLVVLGGDGSFRAMKQFYHDFGVNFVGIPTTIDNDIFGTDYCLGVDTALNVIRNCIDDIKDTAYSFRRAFVIEVMGRDCGYLAAVSALTSGAEMCLIPELEFDLNYLKKRYLKEFADGRTYLISIVAEGVHKTNEIVEWFKNEIGIDTRATVLGHLQRGGRPTVQDRLMAFEFTQLAIKKLLKPKDDKNVIVYKDAKFDFVTIDYINSQKYTVPEQILSFVEGLSHEEKACNL